MPSFKTLSEKLHRAWIFVTQDIWRISDYEVSKVKRFLYNTIRTIILAAKGFGENRLVVRASALTYFTLLAIVPVLSLVLGIAKGFGFKKVLEAEMERNFVGQREVLSYLFKFTDSILNFASSGFIIGIGILFIIWATWAIMNNIEIAFNNIWQITKGRSLVRKTINYLSIMMIIPLLLILSSGLSIFIRTKVQSMHEMAILSPMVEFIVKTLPFFLYWLLFTLLYIVSPNTKVRFKNAAIAGLITGTAFLIFQNMYISGQIWVNRYNTIYGSFAAFPLLLLWLQASWIIVLFGAEITFATQNIENYYFEKETKNISERYGYFIAILIMSLICKRFENGEPPLTARDISTQNHIPIRLTLRMINLLSDINLLQKTERPEEDGITAYLPAMDINKITLGMICQRLFDHGTEDFKVDTEYTFKSHWDNLLKTEQYWKGKGDLVLVKNL